MNFESTALRVAAKRNSREQKQLRFNISSLERKEDKTLREVEKMVSDCKDDLQKSSHYLSVCNMRSDGIDELMQRLNLHKDINKNNE